MFILWTVTVLPLPRFDEVLEMIWVFVGLVSFTLGRRRRGGWLDGSRCIDVGWSQSCCGGVDQDFSISFTLLRQPWFLCL